ncbi:MAG TPA: homoserine dehydrogenase [Thermomicrobiales bacterium]|nr:homoserine dehydrogenase [Thermomicrobiales bacterium]
MTDTHGIAILGLGTIGGAVASALVKDTERIERSSGLTLSFVGGLARSTAAAARLGLDPALVTTDGQRLVDDTRVHVVVEALGGEQPAVDLMCRALASGKHVVTANKEAVAKHLPAIVAAARSGNAGFLCEASVGGGIPLIVSLRQILATNRVERIRGIVNGTTNFILSKMDSEGADYATTLAEAQQLGYAEPDPTADVEGFDASYKLAILASLMLGRHVHPDEIERTGISGVTAADIAGAQARGGTIRLIASADRDGDRARLRVAPTFIPGDDMLSRVVRNFNAIEIVGDRVGPVLLHGQGAGPAPTSSAMLSDVIEVIRTGARATPRLSS